MKSSSFLRKTSSSLFFLFYLLRDQSVGYVHLYIEYIFYLQASNTIYQEGFRSSELQVCWASQGRYNFLLFNRLWLNLIEVSSSADTSIYLYFLTWRKCLELGWRDFSGLWGICPSLPRPYQPLCFGTRSVVMLLVSSFHFAWRKGDMPSKFFYL